MPAVATIAATPQFRLGVSYNPYDASSRCRSGLAIAQDIDLLITADQYDVIRTYGADCGQVRNVLDALDAKWPDTWLYAGVWDVDNVVNETDWLIEQIAGRWTRIHTVSVGNEAVNSGRASVGTVLSALDTARRLLRDAGYEGPIVTVDTMNLIKEYPELCGASDYCSFNCHAFFDPTSPSGNAGPWLQSWIDRIAVVAGGKPLVVAETGWPTQGRANGIAVPSWVEHNRAIESIKNTLHSNVILFSGFNTHCHNDDNDIFQTEQWWGIHGEAPSGA